MFRLLLTYGVVLVGTTAGLADSTGFSPIKLRVQAARLPVPALRYHLLPELREQTTGDAVPLYQRAFEVLKSTPPDATGQRERGEQIDRWQQLSLHDLPRQQIRHFLDTYKEMFQLVEKAARSERCNWGSTATRQLCRALPRPELDRTIRSVMS